MLFYGVPGTGLLTSLSEKLDGIFSRLTGRGVLTEAIITDALREVRLALLEADVNFAVVKRFVAAVKEACLGEDVLKSLTPGQQVIKVVKDELARMMGAKNAALNLVADDLTIILMAGLQGSGKTTTTAKLARRLSKDGKRVLMVACDLQRPAAVKQLETLGGQIDVKVLAPEAAGGDPVKAARAGLEFAQKNRYDVVLFDTAGRLHMDESLMGELTRVHKAISPHETLLVADAMTGQEAVGIAERFHESLTLTGIVLTKLEGDARGGAVLSMREVTGCPVKFVGVGEKVDALEPFHPDRMAGRILGMGDMLSLIEKAETTVSKEKAEQLAKKLKKSQFTLEDFRDQLKQIKKMGSLSDILAMIPGAGKMAKASSQISDKEIGRVEAIISSMTLGERRNHTIINGSRRKRIARGSGTSVQDVNKLLKNFIKGRKMMKAMAGAGGKGFKMKQMLPF